MVNGNSKRVVVIKDIHSNLIEEAILILKNDPEQGSGKEKGDVQRNKKKSNDFLLKEAELIINSYVKENKVSLINGRQTEKRIPSKNNKKLVSAVINAALIGSIALLVFMLSRMF